MVSKVNAAFIRLVMYKENKKSEAATYPPMKHGTRRPLDMVLLMAKETEPAMVQMWRSPFWISLTSPAALLAYLAS